MSEQKVSVERNSFENIRQIDPDDNEFRFARDLAPILDYQDWRNF